MATARKAKLWGDTLAAMEEGKRNPRALVVELNTHMKRSLAWLGSRWAISMNTYDVIDGNAKWRTRVPAELPENDPQAWLSVYETARAIAYSAQRLAEFAEKQHDAAQARINESMKVS